VLVSIPNAVHWSVRAQVALGRFEYTNKGILDREHVRFFTRRSIERMFRSSNFAVVERRTSPIPWETVIPQSFGFLASVVEKVDHAFTRVQPNAFAYQHIFELRPSDDR
jgi:hypothetical protein